MSKIVTLTNHKPALLKLTKTMLEKAIIDANASVRNFSKLCGVDFDHMQSGDKHSLEAEFLDGTPTKISFYRTRNARGDRRLSIKGIKQQASESDTVAITFKLNDQGKSILVINISDHQEYQHLSEASQ
jgi:hypothetical protein